MKASTIAVSHTSLSNTCVTLKASINLIHFIPRLWKDTVSIQRGKKMGAAVGKDCRCINTEWTGAEKQMCHNHIERSLKVTFKASNGNKRRLATCLQRLLRRRNRQNCSVQPNNISFNIVADSEQIKEALSGQVSSSVSLLSCLLFFFYTLTVFYMLLGLQSALHSSPEQCTKRVAHFMFRGKNKNASCCTKLCLFI